MRKNFLFPLMALLVGLAGIIFWLAHKPQQNIPSQSPEVVSADQTPQSHVTNQFTQSQSIPSQMTATPKTTIPDAVMQYVQKIKADPQYDGKQPINFYGRVVDESNEPVVGATVNFSWNNLSPDTQRATVISDGNGRFSLTSQTGSRLSVTVSKEGYYNSGDARYSAFEYANPADGLFTPDQGNPVVFHLRKKGVGVDLVTSAHGINSDLHLAPPTNGSPLFVDFFSRKIGDSGQLKIEGWKELKDFKTAENNWGFQLTVSDGGLIEENDEFPFEAPDSNSDYQPVMEWHFKDGDPDWKGFLKKNFYIKFGNPPCYGTVSIETTAFAPGVYLRYAFNPDGSRNLEPKQ